MTMRYLMIAKLNWVIMTYDDDGVVECYCYLSAIWLSGTPRYVRADCFEALAAEYIRLGRPLDHVQLTPEQVCEAVACHFSTGNMGASPVDIINSITGTASLDGAPLGDEVETPYDPGYHWTVQVQADGCWHLVAHMPDFQVSKFGIG